MKVTTALVLCLAFVACNKPSPRRTGNVDALLAIDDTAAIVAYLSTSASPNWISRIDVQNHVIWSTDITSPLFFEGTGPLSIVDGVLLVRTAVVDRSNVTMIGSGVIALDASTGKFLWDKQISEETPAEISSSHLTGLPSWLSGIGTDHHMTLFSRTATSTTATRIHARSGTMMHTRQYLDNPIRSPWSYGSSYVISLSIDRAELVNADGESTVVKVAGAGCKIGDDYMTVVRRDDASKVTLVSLSTTTGFTSRVIADPFDALGESASVRTCGRYKDRLIFYLDTHAVNQPPKVITTDASGKLLASIPLDSIVLSLDPYYSYPERAILSGDALPRFVPVPDGDTIAMLDLELGKLLWRSRADQFSTNKVLRVGSRWLFLGVYGDAVVFDGNTGQLVDAFIGDGGIIQPTHIAGDTLWTYRRDDAAPDGYTIIALPLSRPQHPAIRHFAEDLRVRWGL